jgi:dUTP pyrophosphatase
MFPNAEIEHNYRVGSNVYDWVVPEHRLALSTAHRMGTADTTGAHVSDTLRAENYRFVLIDTQDLNKIRNRIIGIMNTVYVKDSADVSILTPRLTGDAGWDIITSETVEVPPNQGLDVPSDLFMEIPNHLYGIVQARSSTSKRRLIILPGVIDPAYRGRVYAMTYNPTDTTIKISKGDRIAQMLFMPRILHLSKASVPTLSPTERGEAGFGSTGTSLTNHTVFNGP